MKDELEVHCPKCGKLFKGRDSMFEHLDGEHVSDKEHFKELILEIDARYLGDHSSFTDQINGSLSLYSNPQNKVVFKSAKFRFEIPISKIISAIPKDNIFVMEFEDEVGANQTVFFDHSNFLTQFANELINLRIVEEASEKATTKGNIKEIVIKMRCPYCKYTYDKKLDKCPHCGAMNP
jgi:uncharacterized C2H2 Zn-finger protein